MAGQRNSGKPASTEFRHDGAWRAGIGGAASVVVKLARRNVRSLGLVESGRLATRALSATRTQGQVSAWLR